MTRALGWLRQHPRKLLFLVVGAVIVGLCALALQIRSDLREDVVADAQGLDDLHWRADRWYPLTAPILWAWSRSANEVRFDYAARSFVRLGEEQGRAWLEAELQTNPSRPFPLSVSDLHGLHVTRGAELRVLVRTCLRNIDFRDRDRQFDASVLALLLASREAEKVAEEMAADLGDVPPAKARTLLTLLPDSDYNVQPRVKALRSAWQKRAHAEDTDWGTYDRVRKMVDSAATSGALRAAFESLDTRQQDDFLSYVDASKPAGHEFLVQLADDPKAPCRGRAAFLLMNADGDDQRLKKILTHDLAALGRLETLAQLEIANHFPQSRFAQACKAYNAIRGGDHYFHNEFSEPMESDKPAPRPLPPAEEASRWAEWLAKYPDHPGADDAGFWLGRCLEWQGKRTEALLQYASLLEEPRGDRDMDGAIADRFVMILDVGTTSDDLRAFLQRSPKNPLADVVRYALAVHLARVHDYATALELTADLTPTRISPSCLDQWHGAVFVQGGFYDQRRRWQTLRAMGTPDTLQRRYDHALAWSDVDSWRNGYLMLWQGQRASHFAFRPHSNDVGRSSVIPDGYRSANPMAVALALLQPVARDADGPLLEQTLALEIDLLSRCGAFPECEALVPLPGFPVEIGRDARIYQSAIDTEYDHRPLAEIRAEQERHDWYARQIIAIERRLLETFPATRHAAAVRADLYEATRDERFRPQTGPRSTWDALGGDFSEALQALRF